MFVLKKNSSLAIHVIIVDLEVYVHLHPYFVYASSEGSMTSLCIRPDWPEALLYPDAISTEFSCSGQFVLIAFIHWQSTMQMNFSI